ncbi:DUF6691 family protein [Citreimonas sp.]|uniref:DUF6691 family protein n=1 Tax=Citreimonas sp. TaxID=3036715 RepID=UPI00405949FC
MRYLVALISGAFFGAGLHLSGMTNTAKVQGWLDVFGDWDPTLAFVLGGAMVPMAIAWAVTSHLKASATGRPFPPRPQGGIDAPLAIGSVLFGIGWGLAGLCPGPVVAALSYGGGPLLLFAAAMVVGMLAAPALRGRLDKARAAQ